MSAQSTPIGMDLSPAAEHRNTMFQGCVLRLQRLAYRGLNVHHLRSDQFVVICIAVDSRWRELVDTLMPGTDWQRIRDTGQEPVANGLVRVEFCDTLAEEEPGIVPALETVKNPLPLGKANCVVLDDGGCTVYEVDAIALQS